MLAKNYRAVFFFVYFITIVIRRGLNLDLNCQRETLAHVFICGRTIKNWLLVLC